MKTFVMEFVSRHPKYIDRRITMKANAPNMERLAPRIKKILKHLDRIPSPNEHGVWDIYRIKEEGT